LRPDLSIEQLHGGVSVVYKKILAATDASNYSVRALLFAIELAKGNNAEILLLHAIDYPASYRGLHLDTQSFMISEERIQKIHKYIMEKTLRGIDTKNVPLRKKTVVGNTADVILKESAAGDFDLIVLGTRGHSPITGALIGSVTQKILAKAPCPVLVLK
jgi:nucleotide-binding universal stress UspA family protein